MRYFLVFLSITILLSIILTGSANADTNCQSIYGGGETCSSDTITVTKQVLNPSTNYYVDNLATTDTHYRPNSPIYFKITIQNTSNAPIPRIVVKDTIDNTHEFLDYTSSPGNFDKKTKTLTYVINGLQSGQQSVIIIAGRILSSQNLPTNQSLICTANTAIATLNNPQATETTSQFCIENKQSAQITTKGGLPITNPPQTQTNTFPVYTGSPTIKNT